MNGIARRMLITGAPSADFAVMAEKFAASEQTSWTVDVVPLEASADRCRQSWPDVIVVHAGGLAPRTLRDALRWFRGSARVPVIVLTERAQVEQRLIAIDAISDDDAVLPVEAHELHMRAERLIRRRDSARRHALGDLVLDSSTNEVMRRGEHVRLTPAEFRLLARLAATPNEPVTLEELAGELGGAASRNTVQVHVSSLRRKLEATGPALVHTAHRRGYVLRPTPAVDLEQRFALLLRREQLVKAREEAIARRTELLKQLESRRSHTHGS